MGNKFLTTRQINNTTWILLGLIILLLVTVVLLKPNAASPSSPALTVEAPANGQPAANAKSSPTGDSGDSGGWWPAVVLALQVGVGAGLTGFLIGFKRGQLHEARKQARSQDSGVGS